MTFYLTLAVIMTCLIAIANKSSHKVSILCRVLCILLAAIIGGFRDTSIGTDMAGYGTAYFEEAQTYNSYIKFVIDWHTREYAYATLCYIGKTIYNDIHSYLFLSELIKITLVLSTAWHFRKQVNPCLVVFVYMVFAYWYGLSLMRQSLALCCCFYSLTYFFDKRYLQFGICIAVAYLFHNSAIFFLYLPLITYIFNKTKKPILISTIGIIVLYGASMSAFLFLASTGLFKEEMMELYLDSGVPTAKVNILLSLFLLTVSFIFSKFGKTRRNNKYRFFLAKVSSGKFGKTRRNNKYWFFLVEVSSGLSLLFLFLSSYFEVAFRVSFYMMYVIFIGFPIVLNCIQAKGIRQMLRFLYLMLIVFYYIIQANHGLADTIPYTSKMLGI